MSKDYYRIVEITDTASAEEVKQAYKKLVRKYHPDLNPDEDTSEMFMAVREAYEVLGNPYKRKLYDNRVSGATTSEATTLRYEQVRRKRASRYRRTSYQRRMTYRGNYNNHPANTNTQETGSRQRKTEQYAEKVRYEYQQNISRQNARKAFYYFTIGLKTILALAFFYCASLVLDVVLAREVEKELVLSKRELPWTLADPGMVKVRTENYTFRIKRVYAYKFFTNQYIRVKVTPFRNTVTHVLIQEPRISYFVKTNYKLNSFAILLVWVLIISIPIIFFIQLNPEVAVYLGTTQLLIFVVLLGMLSRG